MKDPLVVVWMGVDDPGPALAVLAERHGASMAYLQLNDPSVGIVLDQLADTGAERIFLVGAAFGTSPGNSWLRRVVAHWWRERADPPDVIVGTGLLGRPDADPAPLLRGSRPVSGAEPGLTSAAWDDVPGHRYQVFVCRGPRCTARGAGGTAAAVTQALTEAGLGDDDVLITHTGCQFPCNHAPVVTVHPDDVWYGAVDASAARRIVAEHLVDGRPVDAHRLARRRR